MEKEYCTNDKQMNEICRHGMARANGDGQEEKPATGTSSNLLRNGDYSTTCQETKSTERKPLFDEQKPTSALQKDGSRSPGRANRQPSSSTNTEDKDKMEQKEEDDETYEELICLVRQFYVERPVNPVAIGYHNIETC